MIVLTTDRILGVAVDEEPLSTYGPGNMLDDSNRNSWVSGFVNDKVTLDANSQVSALFLGRFQADDVKFSFLAKDIFEKINGGRVTLHGYRIFYNGGSYKHTLSTGDSVRTKGGSNSAINVNAVGTASADFKTITTVNDFVFSYDSASTSESGVTVASGGAHGASTFVVSEGSNSFPANLPLRWVTANPVTVTSSSGDLVLTTSNAHGLSVNDKFTLNTTGTLFGYINRDNSDEAIPNFQPSSTANANNPSNVNYYYVKSVPSATTLTLGLSLTGGTMGHYDAYKEGTPGGATHYLNVVKYGLVKTSTNSGGSTTVTIKDITSKDGEDVDATFFGTVGLATYSDVYKGVNITAATIQAYVNDDSDGSVTGTKGARIHQAAVASRVFTSLGNFVQGNITQVSSGFIPIPKQTEKSNVEVDFKSLNERDGGKLITHWMLEELTTSGSSATVGKINYNGSGKGLMNIRLGNSNAGTYTPGSNPGIAVGDYVSLTLPTSLIYPTTNAIKQDATGSSASAKTVTLASTHGGSSGIYEGMTAIVETGGASLGTVTLVDNLVITFDGTVPDGYGGNVIFSNPANVASDADIAFTRVHRVVAVGNGDGTDDEISVYAPNFGTNGDLTRQVSTVFEETATIGGGVNYNRPNLIVNSPTSGRSIQKVTSGKGRFLREVNNQNTISSLVWDASSTGGTATATFTNDHGLVNNDKIVIYNLSSVTNGSHIHNLEGSYLVTYSTAKQITFNITKANQQTLTSLTGANGATTVTGVTSADHGFIKGDKVHIHDSAAHDGLVTIATVPTSKSFTFERSSALGGTLNDTTGGMQATGGVHYRDAVDTFTINALTISNAGTGYTTSGGTLTASGGGGSGFAGTYTADGSGVIQTVTITNGGTGYTSAPTIAISGGGSSGSITPTLVTESYSDASTTSTRFLGSDYPTLANVPVARTISIENAKEFNLASGAGDPIKVGNHLWIDGYEESSSKYSNSTYSKTPTISVSGETAPYETGQSATRKQSTFVADFDSATTVTTNGTAAKNNSPLSQVTLVRGDATASGDVELTPPSGKLNTPIRFSSLRHGILVGIMRAGSSVKFPNPQVGVGNKFKDYSVRKDLKTGSYYFLNRESAKIFNGKITGNPDEINPLADFAQTQLAKPFAVLIISGNQTSMQKLRLRAAIYGYFTDLPSVTFSNKLNNLKDLSFNIKEVL